MRERVFCVLTICVVLVCCGTALGWEGQGQHYFQLGDSVGTGLGDETDLTDDETALVPRFYAFDQWWGGWPPILAQKLDDYYGYLHDIYRNSEWKAVTSSGLVNQAIASDAAFVIYAMGQNDAKDRNGDDLPDTSAAQFYSVVRQQVNAMVNAGKKVILVETLIVHVPKLSPERLATWGQSEPWTIAQNEKLADIHALYPDDTLLVEMHGLYKPAEGGSIDYNDDGVHPNSEGYKVYAQWIFDAILDSMEDAKGDLDRDGDVDLFDALRVVDMLLSRPPQPTPFERWAADLDGDGDRDLFDVLALVDILIGRVP